MAAIVKKLRIILFCLFALHSVAVSACTIFIANDGRAVWVGNNEDERFDKKYRIWYYPAAKGHHGYMIWTELTIGPLFYGLMYKNPQGGLNEHGLFMDYTAVDEAPAVQEPGRKDRKKELVHDLLRSCKTVEEVIRFVSRYNLVRLKRAQLFVADASGDYAVIHGGYIVRKSTPCFALTNYCINKGHYEACYRRDAANLYLGQLGTGVQLNAVKTILEKASQKPPQTITTNYSMAVDLKAGLIHLYLKNDFRTEVVLNLKTELEKGKHHRELATYFPADIAPLLEKAFLKNGIAAATATYRSLRLDTMGRYRFNSPAAENFAISLIEKEKSNEAISFLQMLREYEPANPNLLTWLGVAFRKNGDDRQSAASFDKALELDSGNYLATLWGRQDNRKVTFRLNDFEGAREVSLMGEFTQWKKNAIPMKKEGNVWTCEAVLPRGTVIYKFRVNNLNLTDKLNRMFVGAGPDMFSKLFVW